MNPANRLEHLDDLLKMPGVMDLDRDLNKASPYYASGDTDGDGVLDTTETWRWNNIPSNAITGQN
jgi:hypothetical protein